MRSLTLRCAVILVGCSLAACSARVPERPLPAPVVNDAPAMLMVEGQAMLDGMGLVPPEHRLRVRLEAERPDAAAEVLAEHVSVVEGAGPFAFALPYLGEWIRDASRYRVQAEIVDAQSEPRWVARAPAPVLTQGYPVSAVLQMRPVYSAEDRVASVPPGVVADFRAIGNRPAWLLEIYDAYGARLVIANGAQVWMYPAPEKSIRDQQVVYVAEGSEHVMRVTLSPQNCIDTITGEVFGYQATVELDNQRLRGCGEAQD